MENNHRRSAFEQLPQAIVFDTVIRHGSFSEAAAELGLARSTVSQRVSSLEEALGVRLLHRTTRSMSLTEAGQKLLDEMAPIMSCWQSAEAQLQAYSTDPKGLLVVTAPDMLMSKFVLPAMKRYRSRFPRVEIELRSTTATLHLLDDGIDVAIRAGPLPSSGHGAMLWWRGPQIALASPALAELYPASRPAHLRDAPWIDLTGRRSIERWSHASGDRVPFRIDSLLNSDSLQVFTALLLSGQGFGLLPELLAEDFLRDGTLVRVIEDWHADEVSFHVVTTSARKLNAAVKFFVKELQHGCRVVGFTGK